MAASIRVIGLGCALALAFLTDVVSAQSGARITEVQVRALMDKLTVAANRRDLPALMQALADDVVVQLDFRGADGKRARLKMNRAQYEARMAGGMREVQQYRYRRENVYVSVVDDGQSATVRSRAREVAEYLGSTVVTAVDEETTLRLRDGRLVITAVREFTR
jgi:ketosteroid isomerase-like protein